MVTCSASDFHIGLKIVLNNEPYEIEFREFVKPGKGQAFVRVKLRCLSTGSRIERTFKSTEEVKSADIIDMRLMYIYNDGKSWYFMNTKTFEQIAVDKKVVHDATKWLSNQIECTVTFWNDYPISVIPPNFVELQIVDTNPELKGNTAIAGNKLAVLFTGAVVKVPLFLQVGEIIRINTRSGEYVARVK